MTPKEGAEVCVGLGMAVFPVKAGAKVPACMWRTESAAKVIDWPGNWGVDCGKSKLLVLDLDQKDGRNGIADLRKLAESKQRSFPTTFSVRTPTGGLHLYFVSPGGYGNNRGGFPKSIDVRGDGGYVIAPGSRGSNREYRIEQSSPPIPLPAWVADFLVQRPPGEKSVSEENVGLSDASDTVVQRAVEHVRALPAAGLGERNERTFTLAADLRGCGLSERQTIEVILTEWVPRLPAWDEAEAISCCRNAYRYASVEDIGAAEDTFSVLAGEDSAPSPAKKFFVPPPVRQWIVEGWVPLEGSTLITGTGGVGKSQLVLQLAMCVASGLPFCGYATSPCPVLYVACEDTEDEVHRRVHALRSSPGFANADLESLLLWPRVGEHNTLAIASEGRGLKAGRFLDPLRSQLAAMPEGRKLLIVDTIPDVYYGSENDRMAVNVFVKEVLGGLSKRFGCTVICTAHPPKNDAEYSGSTAWNGSFRSRIYMSFRNPESPDDYRVVKHSKSNYGVWGNTMLLLRDAYGLYAPEDSNRVLAAIDTSVLAAITEASSIEKPLSARASSARYILRSGMRYRDGGILTEEEVLSSVRRLIEQGRVVEVAGQRAGNGLHPAVPKEEEAEA